MLDLRTPHDFVAAFKRRKWLLAVPLLVGLVLSSALALLWPPIYQSVATILIVEPEVPPDLVSSTVTSYADERVQVISRRVMTTPNLISVIEKFGLYAEQRKFEPIGSVVRDMRNDILLNLVSAEAPSSRGGRSSQATIAFTLAFEHRSPSNAQKVLNELVTLFLAENLRTRRQAAAETTQFLQSEADKYRQLLNQYEKQVAQFKEQHAGNLPEQLPIKMQAKDRTERELLDIQSRLKTLQERRIYLSAQLAQLDPTLPSSRPEAQATDPRERLKALRTQYVTLSSKYGQSHPDVRKVEREIAALEKEVGPGGRRAALEAERDALVAQLTELRRKYSDKHPDVMRVQRQLDNVMAKLQTMPADSASEVSLDRPNPAYVQIRAQIEAIDTETNSLTAQQKQLKGRLDKLEQDVMKAPEIEREYRLLNRDYEQALSNYNRVKQKLTTAELGESLEAESKGEQFSLVEPPTLPSDPIKPNRLAILVLGIVLSLGIGGGIAALVEAMDTSVYGPMQLASVTGTPPLVIVPQIRTAADIRRKWMIRALGASGAVVGVVAVLLIVNQFIMPLDVIMAVTQRHMDSFVAGVKGD